MLKEGRYYKVLFFSDLKNFTESTKELGDWGVESIIEEMYKVVTPLFNKFNGYLHKTAGDSFLTIFDSSDEAVSCATEIQRKFKEINQTRDTHHKIITRIGIHGGQINVRKFGDKLDIIGEAVNQASRYEAKAPPGGILISAEIYDNLDQVDKKLFNRVILDLKDYPNTVCYYHTEFEKPLEEDSGDHNKISKWLSQQLEVPAVKHKAGWFQTILQSFTPGFCGRYYQEIINQYSILNTRGLGMVNTFALKLEQIFVDLQIIPSNNPDAPNIDLIAAKELKGKRPIWDFLRSDKFIGALVVVGPPGCGKTTLLQHVALMLATRRHRRYGIRPYIPILLVLRNHVTAILRERMPTLSELVQDYFNDSNQFPKLKLPSGWFERQLDHGKCLVLLDGLDEVGGLQQRKAIAGWIDQQIQCYPHCRFVITSRPQAYLATPLKWANILEVQHFNMEQAAKFLLNWYIANEIESSGGSYNADVKRRANEEVRDLLRRLYMFPALKVLTANPLLLTMVAIVHKRGVLPENRVKLYARICEVFLEHWQREKGLSDTAYGNLSISFEEKLEVFKHLAAYMMYRKVRDISASVAMKIVVRLLKHKGLTDEVTKNFFYDFSNGLLLERQPNSWSFVHPTFQEYLTAIHWLKHKIGDRNLVALISDSWWHETLRLYAALGHATAVIQACLSANTIDALVLALDCLNEAHELDQDLHLTRTMIDHIVANFESPDPNRRHLAAEIKLSSRLNSLKLENRRCSMDLEYITCAEYQLFLDAMREQNKHYQPDHWTDFNFASGQALNPVNGVRAEDARDFCIWLTQQQGNHVQYRLPSPTEAYQYPPMIEGPGTWCLDEDGFHLVGLASTTEQAIEQWYTELSNPSLPLSQSYIFRLTQVNAHELIKALDRALVLNHNLIFGFPINDPDFSRICKRAEKLDNPAFTRDLNRLYNLEYHRSRARDCIQSLEKTLDFLLGHFITRVLDLDLAHCLELARSFAYNLAFAYDVGHTFALVQVLARTQSSDSLETYVGTHARTRVYDPIAHIVDVLEHNDLTEACRLAETVKPGSNIVGNRVVMLLKEILAATSAKTIPLVQQAQRRYVARVLEYAYLGYEEMYKEEVHHPRGKINRIRFYQQAVLEFYRWLQTIIAWEAGNLPVWGGIRIVRELRDIT